MEEKWGELWERLISWGQMVWYSHGFLPSRLSRTLLLLNKHTRAHTHTQPPTHPSTICRQTRTCAYEDAQCYTYRKVATHWIIIIRVGLTILYKVMGDERLSKEYHILFSWSDWINLKVGFVQSKHKTWIIPLFFPSLFNPFLWSLVKMYSFRRTSTSIVLLSVPSPSLSNHNINQRL